MTSAQQPLSTMNQDVRIGLAWMTTGKGIVWHNGGTGGYRSFIGFLPAARRGVVILSNTALDLDDLGFATLDADASLTPTYKAIALPDALLDDYVGNYKLGSNFLLDIFRMKDGLFARATGQSAFPIFPSARNAPNRDHLEAQLTGQPPFPIFASARDKFFYKVVDAQLNFERDAEGKIIAVVLHQNGRAMRASRTARQR